MPQFKTPSIFCPPSQNVCLPAIDQRRSKKHDANIYINMFCKYFFTMTGFIFVSGCVSVFCLFSVPVGKLQARLLEPAVERIVVS